MLSGSTDADELAALCFGWQSEIVSGPDVGKLKPNAFISALADNRCRVSFFVAHFIDKKKAPVMLTKAEAVYATGLINRL